MPGVEIAEQQFGGSVYAALVVSLGVAIGVRAIAAPNEYIPHEHFAQGLQGLASEELSRIWLFIFAIAIHNLPEAMAMVRSSSET